MTRVEAINVLENPDVSIGVAARIGQDPEYWRKLKPALDMAISALRQQDVTDTEVGKNEPLTMDELREAAETGDPVWLVGSKSNNTHLVNGWVVIERVLDDALHQYVDYAEFGSDEPFYFKISDYGDLLKAYRRRPKEADHA